MGIDEKMLADLVIANLNYKTVCDLFGLSEAERQNPGAGEWIVDCIKQYQTSQVVLKSMKMRLNENQSIAAYSPPTPLPPKPVIEGGE